MFHDFSKHWYVSLDYSVIGARPIDQIMAYNVFMAYRAHMAFSTDPAAYAADP